MHEYTRKWSEIVSAKSSIVIIEAFKEIDRRYGPYSADPKEYHDLSHTLDVVDSTVAILEGSAIAHGLEDKDYEAPIIAAACHDVIQDMGPGENEVASVAFAIQTMEKLGSFTSTQIDLVMRCIIATTLVDKDDQVRQSAGDDLMTRIVADADLSVLGMDTQDYWTRVQKLFHERYPTDEVGSKVFNDFASNNLFHFLETHAYLTEVAQRIFPNKLNNLRFLKSIINVEFTQN